MRSEAAPVPLPLIEEIPVRSIPKSALRLVFLFCIVTCIATRASASEVEKALTEMKAGRWKQALEVAGAVKAESSEFARAQYVCGETYLVLGDAKLAEASFRAVLGKKPDAAPAIVGLGRALTLGDKAEEAVTVLADVVRRDASDAMALLALGQAHLALKKAREAKLELGKAYELEPTNPEVARGWVEYLFTENDLAKASKVAQDLGKALPAHAMGPFLEGLALERDHKDSKALEAYELALKRDPNFLDAHKNLAILCHTQNPLYQDTERTQKALEHYERYFALGGKDDELKHVYEQFKSFYEAYMQPKKG